MKLNKRKAQSILEHARLLLDAKEYSRTLEVLEPLLTDNPLKGTAAVSMYCEALELSGRRDDSRRVLEDQLRKHPHDPTLSVRLGTVLLHLNESRRAVELMSRMRGPLGRDPVFLTNYAAGLIRVGRFEEAEQTLAAALLIGGGDDTRLVLAMAKLNRGDAAGAESIAIQVGTSTTDAALRSAARGIEADCRLVQGDPKGALERFRALERDGQLEAVHYPHAALAAQTCGDERLATELMERVGARATAEDRLLFAQVFFCRHLPREALEQLRLADESEGERVAGHDFDVAVGRGRAFRLLGRTAEARAEIERAQAMAEAQLRLVGGRAWLEAGHLAAERGDFEAADAAYEKALDLDPYEPEAKLARESSAKRVAWKNELRASAEARLAAAQAEAETMRRRFVARESELESMRRELEALRHRSRSAEARAEESERNMQAVREEQAQKVREELSERERDADEKAAENIERALGNKRGVCPEALWKMVIVAERTYQMGLYAQLPAAAVAVLFSGALERSLFILLVQRFDAWLDRTDRRSELLRGATRGRRGKRVEYFDRFVESFDRTLDAKPPSLGEVARAIARRGDAPLQVFREFLEEAGLSDSFLDALAVFVQSAKERVRDPVAHGLAIDLTWDELKAFRQQFFNSFNGQAGVLVQLLGPSNE